MRLQIHKAVMPQTYTASSRTIAGVTDVEFSASDVGEVALFYNVLDGVSYFSTIATLVSTSSVTLDDGSYLPGSDIEITGITIIPSAAVSGDIVTVPSNALNVSGLKNYVTDDDLKKYAPNLASMLWKTQTSYAVQIAEAFRLSIDDIRTRGIAIKDVGNFITLATTSIDGISGFNRFIVRGSCSSGNAFITLQGSRDGETWESITAIALDTTLKTQTTVIDSEWAYYRVSEAGSTPTYTASLCETYIDRLTIWRAFEMIYRDFMREPGDKWAILSANASDYYNRTLNSVQMLVDSNANGAVDSDDQKEKAQVMFCR